MVKKWGQFGSFLACSGYPGVQEHQGTRQGRTAAEDGAAGAADAEPEPCENCGKPMALKRGRFGQFLRVHRLSGLQDHPQDRRGTGTPKKPDVQLDETCPQCKEAKLVVKDGRFGAFTSCSNYPKCKYIKPKTIGRAVPESRAAAAKSSSAAPSAARSSMAA